MALTEPIGINSIADAIGVSSYDLYTLSLHANVNKFSKKKPYRGTSPERPIYNASVGSDGAPAGTNPRWGLLVPTNTAYQLGLSSASRFLKPLAWRAAKRTTFANNVQNYTYLRLRPNTDFARMDDWVGYVNTAPDPWHAGVGGAEANAVSNGESNGTHMSIDTFDDSEISFYFGQPSNASLTFKDLFISDDYYFIAELYKNDQSASSDTDVPEAVIVVTQKLSAMDSYGKSLHVRVNKIKSLLGFSGDGEHKLIAVMGVSRITAINPASYEEKLNGKGLGYAIFNTDALRNNLIAGEGSLPPWTAAQKAFVCDITLHSYSKIEFQFTQYASPTSTTYQNLPTTAINYASDGLRLKATVKNIGTTAFTFNDNLSRNRVQIQPRGSYDTAAPSYSSLCNSPAEGKWHELKVSNNSAFGNTNAITIAGGSSNAAVYFQALGFLPIGRTMGFNLRISTDGGVTWVITGSFAAAFIVS